MNSNDSWSFRISFFVLSIIQIVRGILNQNLAHIQNKVIRYCYALVALLPCTEYNELQHVIFLPHALINSAGILSICVANHNVRDYSLI